MRTLTNAGSQIVASTVKESYWLFKIDIGNTGKVDYYLSTKARSYNGNNYTANIKSFTPPSFAMPDMPNKIIPTNKMDIKVIGIDSIELTPNNTAVADGIGRTEADSTTGWSNYGAPDIFESDSSSADPPNVGSYQFHVVEAGAPHAGFRLDNLSLVAGDEMELTFDCRVVTGTLRVVVTDGDNDNITTTDYTNSSYESKTITYTVITTGSSGSVYFYKFDTEAGEFYVDNVSLKRKKRPFPSNFEDAAITVSLIIRAKNIELVPNNTAISDSRTEGDSITGLSSYNDPETFESDSSSADPPNVGSYHCHIIESAGGNGGFQINNIKTISGKSFTLTFDCKIVSGGLRVFIDNGDGTLNQAVEYSNSSYESKTITGTFTATGNSGRVVFYTYPGDGEFYIDNVSWVTETEEEIAWRYIVDQAYSIDRVLLLNCRDWFTKYLEGDYPNTRLVADLFPADIMRNDNYVVPLVFGTSYIPIRLTFNIISATYVDNNTFTVQDDRTSQFQATRYLVANCGVDGLKVCTVSSSSHSGGTTTIDINETNLTSNLVRVQLDAYLLGPSSPTYTVAEMRTPREMNFKSTYDPGDYTFRQSNAIGGDANTYKMLEVLGNDISKNGTNDSNSTWGLSGKQAYDSLVKFSRDDLVGITDPTAVAEYMLEAWGIPSDEIDDTAKATAAAIFSSRSFTLDVGLYYRRSRIDIISELFAISGMIINYRDDLAFKVLTKVSQETIEDDDIKPGTYRTRRAFTQKQKDSGYVTWQTADEPIDQVNKSIVPAKSSFGNPSSLTIRGEWCLDSVNAQTAAKLALQRVVLKDKVINLTVLSTFLSVEPGDMITINSINYDQELSSYDCLITKMTIQEGLWIDLECIRFYDDLDDWDDLAPSSISVYGVDTSNMYIPLSQGQGDSVGLAGGNVNELNGLVIVKSDGHFRTTLRPSVDGGADLGNETFECFTTGGDSRFLVDYSGGADDGDVVIGNYDGGAGIKWDQSAGILYVKGTITAEAGAIGGWDITATTLESGSNNIKLDSSGKAISINDATFGNSGIQLQYNSGTPRFYVGDGSNAYLQFDGTKIQVKASNFELDSSGNLICSGGTIAGWTIDSDEIKKITANAGIAIDSSVPHILLTDGNSYERVLIGKYGADYGIKIRDESNNLIVQLDDNVKTISGWTAGTTTLAVSTNVVIDASNKAISINDTTYGNDGIQLQYNAGNPRFYCGDGSNSYLKYDGTNVEISVDSTAGLTIVNGGDIILVGNDSSPGKIVFEGTNSAIYSVEIGISVDGDYFAFTPTTTDVTDLIIGKDTVKWSWADNRFKSMGFYVSNNIGLYSGDFSTENSSFIGIADTPSVTNHLYDVGNDLNHYLNFQLNGLTSRFYPSGDSTIDLGSSGNTWQDFHTQKIITYDTSRPIVIAANAGAGVPSHSAIKGTLYVTSAGVLYINTDGSTTWAKVGGQ